MKKKTVEKITKISLAMLTTLCISSQLCGCAITASSGSIETTDMEQTSEMEDMTALGQTTANADQVSDKQSNITSNSIDGNTSDGTGSNLIVSADGSTAAEGSWDDVIDEPEEEGEKIDYDVEVENEGAVTDYKELAIYKTEAGKSEIDNKISGKLGHTFPNIVNNYMENYDNFRKKAINLDTAVEQYKKALVKAQPTTPAECHAIFIEVSSEYIDWDAFAAYKQQELASTEQAINNSQPSTSSGPTQHTMTQEEADQANQYLQDNVYTGPSDWYQEGWDTDSIGQ